MEYDNGSSRDQRKTRVMTDDYKPEAFFRYEVKQLSKMKVGGRQLSPSCMIRGLPWKIMAMCVEADRGPRALGFFLQCNEESDLQSWSCNAQATLRMLSQKEGVTDYERKISKMFSPKGNAWGLRDVMQWDHVLDPKKGYIKDDTIILEVEVRADAPHGVQEEEEQKEKSEAHLHTIVNLITEDCFEGHQGFDLIDFESENKLTKKLRVRKSNSIKDLYEILGQQLNLKPFSQFRLWAFRMRHDGAVRPVFLKPEDLSYSIGYLLQHIEPELQFFLEIIDIRTGETELRQYDAEKDTVVFLKYYRPETRRIIYCGHAFVPHNTTLEQLKPEMRRRAALPTDAKLLIYHEDSPSRIEHVENCNMTLNTFSSGDSFDGLILVFQLAILPSANNYELPTVNDYFRELSNRIEVELFDKMEPNAEPIIIIASLPWNYVQFVETVGKQLNHDPYKIQFFKYKEAVGQLIKWNPSLTLKQMLSNLCFAPDAQQRKRGTRGRLYFQKSQQDEIQRQAEEAKQARDEAAARLRQAEERCRNFESEFRNVKDQLDVAAVASRQVENEGHELHEQLQGSSAKGVRSLEDRRRRLEEILEEELAANGTANDKWRKAQLQVEQLTSDLSIEIRASQKLEAERQAIGRQNEDLKAKVTELEAEIGDLEGQLLAEQNAHWLAARNIQQLEEDLADTDRKWEEERRYADECKSDEAKKRELESDVLLFEFDMQEREHRLDVDERNDRIERLTRQLHATRSGLVWRQARIKKLQRNLNALATGYRPPANGKNQK